MTMLSISAFVVYTAIAIVLALLAVIYFMKLFLDQEKNENKVLAAQVRVLERDKGYVEELNKTLSNSRVEIVNFVEKKYGIPSLKIVQEFYEDSLIVKKTEKEKNFEEEYPQIIENVKKSIISGSKSVYIDRSLSNDELNYLKQKGVFLVESRKGLPFWYNESKSYQYLIESITINE